MSDFGELRSLLQSFDDDAQRRAWPRLIELFDAAFDERPDEAAEVWLPYALEALERWPDRFRYAPKGWVRRIADGEDLGLRMTLIKAIRLLEYDGGLLEDICGHRAYEWVRHIELHGCLYDSTAQILGQRRLFPRLSSLEITGARLKAHLWPTAWLTPELETLTIRASALDPISALKIFKEGDFARLSALDISDNPDLEQGILALARAEVPCLNRLDISRSWTYIEHVGALCGWEPWAGLEWLRLERSPTAARDRVPLKGPNRRQVIRNTINAFAHGGNPNAPRERAYQRSLVKMARKMNREDRLEALLRGSGLAEAVVDAALEGNV